jgi:hypothetical protein
MARGNDRRTGYEEVTGQTPDISEWLDFEFYDLVWWLDRPTKPNFTDNVCRLARWIGVSHRVGSDLSYWLITESGKIISKMSVEHVIRDDYLQADKRKEIDVFNLRLEASLDDANFMVDGEGEFDSLYLQDIDDNLNSGVRRADDDIAPSDEDMTPTSEDYGDMHTDERPEDDDEEAVDKYLNVELLMNVGTNDERHGRVVKRSWGLDSEPIGRAHANPLFDTREYEIEFTDGTHEKYQANVIAENMFAQVDSEGNQFLLLQEITDHKKDHSAIPISEGTVQGANGQAKPKVTTKGWFLLVQWKDGSISWENLKDLKASNPVEVAEYAVANRLVEEPAFKWWVPHVLRRRNSRYWKTTHKFGIRLPKTVEEALDIDKATDTDF